MEGETVASDRTFLELNPSQLRNLRNWTSDELPQRVLRLVLPVPRPVTAAEAWEALRELIRAHEALRSRLARDEAGRLLQEVMPPEAAAARFGDLVRTAAYQDDDPRAWEVIPIPPGEGALRAVFFIRRDRVVAIKLCLAHIFVDALGLQAAARHLRQLLAGDAARGLRAARQASAFAKPPEHPDIKSNTEYWRGVLSDAPRSCTYSAVRRDREEACQIAEESLSSEEAGGMELACKRLGVSPHVAWVTAVSSTVSRLSGSDFQVVKATYSNRLWPADFRVIAQIAQPIFTVVAGQPGDSMRERAVKVARSLASSFRRGMYDANSLLDWLSSDEVYNGAAFQPAFEVNYIPVLDHREPGSFFRPDPRKTRLATMRIDPHSAKPEIILAIRHLPAPYLQLTVRRPVSAERDARTVLQHCLTAVRALCARPDTAVSQLPIPQLPASKGLLRGHRSQAGVDLPMTRMLVASAPGIEACEVIPVRDADGTVRIRARLRSAGRQDPAGLAAWLRREQPWFAGSVVPDELAVC